MNVVPDFVPQAQDIIRQLEAQAQVTAQYWSDSKRNEFYNKYVTYILDWMDGYIHGSHSCKIIRGKGLNDLLQFVSEKVEEFESFAGSITSTIVHYEKGNYGSSAQILAPSNASSTYLRCFEQTSVTKDDVPEEQTPSQISENRRNWTVDYNLNSPGSFSAENLRNILNRRRNN